MKLDRPRQILLIGAIWSLCNFIFVCFGLSRMTDLANVQRDGVAAILLENRVALPTLIAYIALTIGFCYAVVSQFHHARKRGRAVGETLAIFASGLAIQVILLACQNQAFSLAGQDLADAAERTLNARFGLLVAFTLASHLLLIAMFTASVWQRKLKANNFGVHFLIGLPAAVAMIVMSLPPSVIDLGDASWTFYLWFCSMPLCFAWSCATELRPPYLLKLSH